MTTDQGSCPRCDHAWGWHRSRWGFFLGLGDGGRAIPCRYDQVNPCGCDAVPADVSFMESVGTIVTDAIVITIMMGLFVGLPLYFALR